MKPFHLIAASVAVALFASVPNARAEGCPDEDEGGGEKKQISKEMSENDFS